MARKRTRDPPAFRIEFSYVHLEMERYLEVSLSSLPGFISQLGG